MIRPGGPEPCPRCGVYHATMDRHARAMLQAREAGITWLLDALTANA